MKTSGPASMPKFELGPQGWNFNPPWGKLLLSHGMNSVSDSYRSSPEISICAKMIVYKSTNSCWQHHWMPFFLGRERGHLLGWRCFVSWDPCTARLRIESEVILIWFCSSHRLLCRCDATRVLAFFREVSATLARDRCKTCDESPRLECLLATLRGDLVFAYIIFLLSDEQSTKLETWDHLMMMMFSLSSPAYPIGVCYETTCSVATTQYAKN